jgi:hypothetical protein
VQALAACSGVLGEGFEVFIAHALKV